MHALVASPGAGDMVAGALPAGKLFGNYFSRTARDELRCPPGAGVKQPTCANGASLDFRPRSGSVLVGAATGHGHQRNTATVAVAGHRDRRNKAACRGQFVGKELMVKDAHNVSKKVNTHHMHHRHRGF